MTALHHPNEEVLAELPELLVLHASLDPSFRQMQEIYYVMDDHYTAETRAAAPAASPSW